MPIFEYQCRRCSQRLEVMQRWSDPPPTECQQCGGELKKLVSAPAFQFKGSGWYVTDYARKGSGGEDAKESKGSSDGDSGKEKAAGGEGAKSTSGGESGADGKTSSASTTAGSSSNSSSTGSSSSSSSTGGKAKD